MGFGSRGLSRITVCRAVAACKGPSVLLWSGLYRTEGLQKVLAFCMAFSTLLQHSHMGLCLFQDMSCPYHVGNCTVHYLLRKRESSGPPGLHTPAVVSLLQSFNVCAVPPLQEQESAVTALEAENAQLLTFVGEQSTGMKQMEQQLGALPEMQEKVCSCVPQDVAGGHASHGPFEMMTRDGGAGDQSPPRGTSQPLLPRAANTFWGTCPKWNRCPFPSSFCTQATNSEKAGICHFFSSPAPFHKRSRTGFLVVFPLQRA